MFVIAQDFDLPPYQIPNLDKIPNTFQDFVDEREASVLTEVLGYKLYKDFIAGLNALPEAYDAGFTYANLETVVSGNDIWQSLQDNNEGNPLTEGAWWTLVEEDNKWLELKNGCEYPMDMIWVGMKKMLTPYIYSEWLSFQMDSHTGIGLVVAKAENSVGISPATRISRAFNDYSRLAGSWWDNKNTLYGFVKQGDYEGFDYTYQGYRNEFGI